MNDPSFLFGEDNLFMSFFPIYFYIQYDKDFCSRDAGHFLLGGWIYKKPCELLVIPTNLDINDAIKHSNKYGTKHSDCIITENIVKAEDFLNQIDSACVYVNASTRFSDGGEFGFGAEIGISTQKLHARGPMGLKEMTTYKYKIYGEGQIR